jgi:hypothetical protein
MHSYLVAKRSPIRGVHLKVLEHFAILITIDCLIMYSEGLKAIFVTYAGGCVYCWVIKLFIGDLHVNIGGTPSCVLETFSCHSNLVSENNPVTLFLMVLHLLLTCFIVFSSIREVNNTITFTCDSHFFLTHSIFPKNFA